MAMAIKKILIVDDSPTDRQFFMETLSKQGYQVVTAENGDEAITKAKSERPDLILMDVVMPGTNGFQATRAITRDEATKHIPVIFFFQAEDGIRDLTVTGVQTCALPI